MQDYLLSDEKRQNDGEECQEIVNISRWVSAGLCRSLQWIMQALLQTAATNLFINYIGQSTRVSVIKTCRSIIINLEIK